MRTLASVLCLSGVLAGFAACGNENDPSVSGVYPTAGFIGRKLRVEVSGDATHWDQSTTVDFGPGITVDAIDSRPATHPQRASFTIAIQTARDQVITANAITPDTNNILIGAIGTAVLANLLPTRRPRAKARTRKHATSKYARNAGQFPPTAQRYTLHTEVKIMETGLTARSKT